MAVTLVLVPDIGDFDNVPVIEILVTPGERVDAEQSLVTLESDKATMEVPAPHAGVVGTIRVAVGDEVSAGSPLLELDLEPGDEPAPSPVEVVDAPAPRASESAPEPPPAVPAPARGRGSVVHASPVIRRFARTLGVDLGEVAGTGHKRRILRADVERYVRERLAGAGAASGGMAIPPIPAVDFSRFGPVRTEPLSRIKRISGPFLLRAWLNVPHVTYHDEVDITELEAFRQALKDDPAARGSRITLLPLLMKALCAALRAFPVFNSSLSPDAQSLIYKQYFHIGVAVDTPEGLVVPVVRDVDGKGIVAIADELSDLSSRAREGKLKADDMQGGCMSISSLGGIGGTAFTPLVNAPEVAILGVARSRLTPVWDGTGFAPRLILPLSLSFDHRVADGAEAAHFMRTICARLADLRTLLL